MSHDCESPPNNGAVPTIAQIIKSVITSVSEDVIGVMYINAYEVIPIRKTLIEMIYPQLLTPMHTNNLAAHSVVTNNVLLRRLAPLAVNVAVKNFVTNS